MIASLWVSDLGRMRGLLFRPPAVNTIDGLVFSSGGVGSNLRTGHAPRLLPGRAVWFAVWERAAALDRFEADIPARLASFSDGCRIRLQPIRVFQRNISVFDDDLTADTSNHDGPVLVVTVAKPKLFKVPRFLVATVPAERAAVGRDDVRWSMGFSRPPRVFATVTVWDSGTKAATYAHGTRRPEHRRAMEASDGLSWFSWNLTVRSRPISMEGILAQGSPKPDLLGL